MKNIIHYALVLFIIAGTAGLGLYGVNAATRARIEASGRAALAEGQRIAFPGADKFSNAKTFPVNGKDATYYEVYDASGKCIGYELLYSVQGYQSQIKVLTGITPDGTVKAIKILSQAETPGLGAEVDAVPSSETLWQKVSGGRAPVTEGAAIPAFQAQYAGKTLGSLKVVKEKTDKYVEAISGATITSDTVTKAVKEPLEAFLKFKQGKTMMNDE